MKRDNLPEHVAIIMDGNGRWAKKRNLNSIQGHRKGIERLRQIVKVASKIGIKVITFFAFSTENWKRPKSEVNALLGYLDKFLLPEAKKLRKKNIRLKIIGERNDFSVSLQKKIEKAEELTRNNNGLTVVLALNYGSQQEIVSAVQKIVRDVLEKRLKPEDISKEILNDYLYTAGLVFPDLLIRTSGELRISNFLLWQIAYSELYFSEKYWPDFKEEDFLQAIEDYQRRERRFGGR